MKAWPIIFVIGCATSGDGPHLDMVTPSSAPRGASVMLAGERFCTRDCSTTTGEILLGLSLPQTQAIVTAYDDTSATITIPDVAPTGSTSIVLVVDGRSSNDLEFVIDE